MQRTLFPARCRQGNLTLPVMERGELSPNEPHQSPLPQGSQVVENRTHSVPPPPHYPKSYPQA